MAAIFCKSITKVTPVWTHFSKEKNGNSAKCNLCKKVLKSVGGSTGALHNHLKLIHNINLMKRTEIENLPSTQPGPSTAKVSDFFPKKNDDSLCAILSRMTASDGIPLSTFCTSPDLRNLLIAKGFSNIPKCPNTIRKKIIDYANIIRENIVSSIQLKRDGGLSLTFDEWTSTKNRRYLNINVHSGHPKGQFWNLGLMRIHGSLPAEKCIQLLKSKLQIFGLSLESDIICITTDGASVMKKIGRLITPEHQLCIVHGIQLAVLSVLYKQNVITNTNFESDSDLIEDSDDDDRDNFDIGIDNENQISLSHPNLFNLISKIRCVVKLFRNSPTKNDDVLQKYVKMEIGKEKSLILDSRTRWNSLLNMVERFYLLKSCIQKALFDIKSNNVFTETEFEAMADIISVLQPLRYAVECLCRQDANLLTAEATLKFLLSNLHEKKNESSLAVEMKAALELRIKERRSNYSALLLYLHNGNDLKIDKTAAACFPELKKKEINSMIRDIVKRHTSAESEIDTAINSDHDIETESSIDFRNKMLNAISKQMVVKPTSNTSSTETLIKREILQFEIDGTRGKLLEKVYGILKSIPPTSVESERAFSAAGAICTKIRSSLNDETIDKLCFLRAYFKNNKE